MISFLNNFRNNEERGNYANNLVYGQISPFLYNSLHYIDFSHNRLYGQIPPFIFKNENLRALMLSFNDKLIGNIFFVICELKFLEILDLSNNGFSGFIPQCLGNFSDVLSVLHLGANNLQGNIPSIHAEGNDLSYHQLCEFRISGSR
jgi:vacuolar-type H+-ATPase subunit I/STV1